MITSAFPQVAALEQALMQGHWAPTSTGSRRSGRSDLRGGKPRPPTGPSSRAAGDHVEHPHLIDLLKVDDESNNASAWGSGSV